MVGADPSPIAAFHKLAIALLDEARDVLQFRMGYGRDWDDLRRTGMPAHLRAPLQERHIAESNLQDAKHELTRAAQQDIWYGERGEMISQARSESPEALEKVRKSLIEEMEDRVAAAADLEAKATNAVKETEEARRDAEVRLARQWRENHHQRLAELVASYEREFTAYRYRLGGLVELSQHELGALAHGAASACQVLLIFAQRVAASRLHTFQGLDPDQLRAAVETEIGRFAQSVSMQALANAMGRGPDIIVPTDEGAKHAAGEVQASALDGVLPPAPGTANDAGDRSWPPPEHATTTWDVLTPMEKDQVQAFLAAGASAVLEVPAIANKARGVDKPNRHDKEASMGLDEKGLTARVGRTGRRLIAVPRGMPKQVS